MSRDAFIAARRPWWRAYPPETSALALALFVVTALVAAEAPRMVTLSLTTAVIAIGIFAPPLWKLRQSSVVVELPHEVSPDRARALLLDCLRHLEGVRNPASASCRIVSLPATATAFELRFTLAVGADRADVCSRVLARVWHKRQRAITRPASDTPAALQTLDCTPLFVTLPGDVKEEMAAAAEVEFWDSGEHVVEQDEPGDSCFIVRRGRLGVYVSNGESEAHIATLGQGDLFGEMSLLTGEPRGATVISEDDAELIRIRASALRGALKRSPELVQLLAETAALRSDAVMEARAALDAERGARR